ncbi:MAG: cell division ATPase MinD [Candidatus Woesearchaeota archaeon]|nr:cell division ATPase MinD [Candidatus Woesearchaeota archaeon]
MTKFIVVASSKGGVGKTTTAINLGTALTIFGRDVIVVDCNLSTPNVSLYLGAASVPITLHDVLNRGKKITDALYMHSHGLKIIPASTSMKDRREIDYEKLQRVIKELSGTCDFVIIDSSAGLNDEAINAIKMGDEILVVSTPELPAISDALRTMKLAKDHNKKVSGVILTRAYDDELELSKKDVEAILETKVIGIIPEDETMREAVKMKNPVTHTHPNAPSSLGYKKLAAELIGEKYVESKEKEESTADSFLKRLGLK